MTVDTCLAQHDKQLNVLVHSCAILQLSGAYFRVPVLLVMFGDLFVEVLWRAGDEEVVRQIA